MSGTLGLVVVLICIFAAVFTAMSAMLGAGAEARRRRDLMKRMIGRRAEGTPGGEEDRGMISFIPDGLVAAGQQLATSRGFSARLDHKLERAGLTLKVGEFVAGSAICGAAGGVLGALLLNSIVFGFLLAIVAGAAPVALIGITAQRRTDKLHQQLPNILTVLASSLRAGHSFIQALDMVSKEIGPPGADEFARAVAEIRLGRPVDEVMLAMAERIGSEDFKWAVLGVNVQREVGGNLAEVLDTIAETIRERERIRRQIKVLSAEGRLSMHILIGLPIVIGLYIAMVNPDYLGLLFKSGIGRVMLVVAGGLLILGYSWMRKVVKIDV